MLEVFFKIWYLIVILPIYIFQEANKKLIDFFKKRDVPWDTSYSILFLLVLLLMALLITGYH